MLRSSASQATADACLGALRALVQMSPEGAAAVARAGGVPPTEAVAAAVAAGARSTQQREQQERDKARNELLRLQQGLLQQHDEGHQRVLAEQAETERRRDAAEAQRRRDAEDRERVQATLLAKEAEQQRLRAQQAQEAEREREARAQEERQRELEKMETEQREREGREREQREQREQQARVREDHIRALHDKADRVEEADNRQLRQQLHVCNLRPLPLPHALPGHAVLNFFREKSSVYISSAHSPTHLASPRRRLPLPPCRCSRPSSRAS